jgi:hypothetical protein
VAALVLLEERLQQEQEMVETVLHRLSAAHLLLMPVVAVAVNGVAVHPMELVAQAAVEQENITLLELLGLQIPVAAVVAAIVVAVALAALAS